MCICYERRQNTYQCLPISSLHLPINTSPHLSVSACSWYNAHLLPLHGLQLSHFLPLLAPSAPSPAPPSVASPLVPATPPDPLPSTPPCLTTTSSSPTASHFPRPSSHPAIAVPCSTHLVQNATQQSSHATAPNLGANTT